MTRHQAFTLAEMLAVLGIMLLLAAASFGVLNMVAQKAGPDSTIPLIQAIINNARDYAVTNGCQTQVHFSTTTTGDGSTMELQYKPANTWIAVPNRQPLVLHNQIYVCSGFPSSLALPAQAHGATGATQMTAEDAVAAQKANDTLLTTLTGFAMSGGRISTSATSFNIVLEPTGCLTVDSNLSSANAVTVVQVAGDKVGSYAFYILNRIAGTPLIFE